MNASVAFLGGTVVDLITEMEPPRLQAVLRMTEARIKSFTAKVDDCSY